MEFFNPLYINRRKNIKHSTQKKDSAYQRNYNHTNSRNQRKILEFHDLNNDPRMLPFNKRIIELRGNKPLDVYPNL